ICSKRRDAQLAGHEAVHCAGPLVARVGKQDLFVDGWGVRVDLLAASLLGLGEWGKRCEGTIQCRPNFSAMRLGHACGERSELK
ncbi:hypothetical protein DB799_22065, partial [Xanthomonas perforans]